MAVSPSALGKVVEVFERNFRDRGELGASVSIWWDGAELLSHGHGWCEREQKRPWTSETLVPVYSATKVPAAATLLLALASRGLNEETPVREVWPRFPVAGARFSHLLSHQCGLSALDKRASVLEHAAVVECHRGAGSGMGAWRWPWLSSADFRRAGGRTGAPPHRAHPRRLLAGNDRRPAGSRFLDRPAGNANGRASPGCIPERRARMIWRMRFTNNSPPPAPSRAGPSPRRAGSMRSMK